MSSHDEYSSDEEDLLDKSSVVLGFVDAPIDQESDVPTIEDTFIGGSPIWLAPNSAPKEAQLACDNCKEPLALLLQAFSPIDGKLYDRIIYIFACKNTGQCSRKNGSVKCFRGISKDPARIAELTKEQEDAVQQELDAKLKLENKKQLQFELTKDLFKKDDTKKSANPFGKSENPFGSGNPFGTSDAAKKDAAFGKGNPFATPFAKEKAVEKSEVKSSQNGLEKAEDADVPTYASISAQAAKETKVEEHKLAPVLPSYPGSFLYVDQEKFKRVTLEPELEKYKHLIEEMDDNEPEKDAKPSSSAALNPQTSKISSMLDDKHFESFSNTVQHNPSQVLRYDLGGKPLLFSGKDDVAKKVVAGTVPAPGYNPSSKRQFELQLMPKAILDLEKPDASMQDILNGMSWGTIVVYTDVEDYIGDDELDDDYVGYVQEWCGVQWEESV